jgi:anti-sigma factor RsiW
MTDDITNGPAGPDQIPPGVLVPCLEILDTIMDYIEGALPPDRSALVDEHLAYCDGCRTVLEQWHTVVDLAGRVTTDDLDAIEPTTRARLLQSFREHHELGQ